MSSSPAGTRLAGREPFPFAGIVLTLAVAAIVTVVHWPSLSSGALLIDDDEYLVDNHLVRNPGWASAGRFLCEVRTPSTVAGYYQPLSMISLMLDCAAGGSPENLAPFHRTSLLLHVANTVLIVMLVRGLIGSLWAALIVGLLFGVHPMTVEPISWVGERKTVLATFFALGSLVCYVKYARTGQWAWYGAALLVFVPALLSKPTTVPLPLVLLVLDFWPLNRLNRRSCCEKVPFFFVAAVSAAITVVSQHHVDLTAVQSFSTLQTLLLAAHNLVFYPCKILWPVNLAPLYEFPATVGLSNHLLVAALLANVVLVAVLLVSLRWTKALLAGWLCFFLLLLPTLMNKSYSPSVAWDKYAYLPALGVLLLLGAGIAALWGTTGPRASAMRGAVVGVALVLCVLEAVGTQRYIRQWRDSETLAHRMVTFSPNAGASHNYLGSILLRERRYDEADKQFRMALDLQPNDAMSLNNMGAILHQRGRSGEAVQYFERATIQAPRRAPLRFNLANALTMLGRLDEACEYYRQATDVNPYYEPAYVSWGIVLKLQGKYDDSLRTLRKALELDPRSSDTYKNVADVLMKQGKSEEAVTAYRRALELDPRNKEAHNNLANLLAAQGRVDEAIREYGQAIACDPKYGTARKNLAELLSGKGQSAEAVAQYREIVRADPASAVAHNDLGAALTRAQQTDAAIVEYQAAADLDPKYTQPRFNLGTIFLSRGQMDRAAELLTQVTQLKPDHAEAHNRLAYAMEKLGRKPEALEHYRRAVELAPNDASAAWNLAEALSWGGPNQESLPLYQRVARLQPNNARAQCRIGDVLRSMGRVDGAKRAYEEALRLQADYAEAKAGLNSLSGVSTSASSPSSQPR